MVLLPTTVAGNWAGEMATHVIDDVGSADARRQLSANSSRLAASTVRCALTYKLASFTCCDCSDLQAVFYKNRSRRDLDRHYWMTTQQDHHIVRGMWYSGSFLSR
jgi:hypothetical protein